jgi:hypothetical protein
VGAHIDHSEIKSARRPDHQPGSRIAASLYAPPRHDRRANDFYRTPADLAGGLLAGLWRAGLKLPTPIHDPCSGDAALLDGLGLTVSGSDLFPGAYPSDLRLLYPGPSHIEQKSGGILPKLWQSGVCSRQHFTLARV